jgi:hypothetical protein
MSQPKWLEKYLTMKPEVSKIFDDLEAWHDHCRFEMINFNPADLYRSREYKEWDRRRKGGSTGYLGKKPWVNRNGNGEVRPYNGERKPYQGNRPRYNDNFSR